MTQTSTKLVARQPIVVVMGHVDHGKTTLLDYIRKTSVAAKESGGITQHIGAYEIEHPSTNAGQARKITFIDTPGHEAFSKMRSRGARVADIAVLMVAADESVKPQTEDALDHIKAAGVPFIVAINKIDKPGASPDKVKQDLATRDVLVEDWGGKIPVALISAKSGEGVPQLLDLILLAAELEEIKGDPEKTAEGVVIESHPDPKRGPTATLVVLDGTLKRGDSIVAGSVNGKVKILEDFSGKPIESIALGAPARVLGWEKLPEIGETFRTGTEALTSKKEIAKTAKPAIQQGEIGIILKADVAGSLEALRDAVVKLAEKVGLPIRLLEASAGEITESDVKLADTTRSLIASFRSKISREAESFLKTRPQKILQSDVIYELLENLEKELEAVVNSRKAAEITGRLEVLATFGEKGGKQVIGGMVREGKFTKGAAAKIIRRDTLITKGKISNLQLKKQDVAEVDTGNECGILFDAPIKVARGDILEISGQ